MAISEKAMIEVVKLAGRLKPQKSLLDPRLFRPHIVDQRIGKHLEGLDRLPRHKFLRTRQREALDGKAIIGVFDGCHAEDGL